jgi:hypothetical protein
MAKNQPSPCSGPVPGRGGAVLAAQVEIDWSLISRFLATSATDRPASTRSSTLRRNSGGYRAVPCHSLPDRVAQESNNPPLENPGHTTRTWSGHRGHRLWWSFLALQLTDFYQEPASPETDREGREHSGRRALTTHAR